MNCSKQLFSKQVNILREGLDAAAALFENHILRDRGAHTFLFVGLVLCGFGLFPWVNGCIAQRDVWLRFSALTKIFRNIHISL